MSDETGIAYPPVRRSIEVRCSPERAFDLFTRTIGVWWPMATHSVYGQGGSVAMGAGVGAEIVETSTSGERTMWGRVTIWEPGQRLAFTWHPGVPLDESTDVEVSFAASPAGTLVELVHRGWERRREPARSRASYESGWIPVLERLRDIAEAAAPPETGRPDDID